MAMSQRDGIIPVSDPSKAVDLLREGYVVSLPDGIAYVQRNKRPSSHAYDNGESNCSQFSYALVKVIRDIDSIVVAVDTPDRKAGVVFTKRGDLIGVFEAKPVETYRGELFDEKGVSLGFPPEGPKGRDADSNELERALRIGFPYDPNIFNNRLLHTERNSSILTKAAKIARMLRSPDESVTL